MKAQSQPQIFVKKSTPKPAFSGIKSRKWWKKAIMCQIYSRSFKDADGYLKGIIANLDDIKCLGIYVGWLNPIYGSPN